jgi:hypothetical protein
MKELLIGLCLAGVTGCCWLAWNHPKAYAKLAPWVGGVALAVLIFVHGLSQGFKVAIEKMRADLTPAQIETAEAAVLEYATRTDPVIIVSGFVALFVWLLFLLELLPRGRE